MTLRWKITSRGGHSEIFDTAEEAAQWLRDRGAMSIPAKYIRSPTDNPLYHFWTANGRKPFTTPRYHYKVEALEN